MWCVVKLQVKAYGNVFPVAYRSRFCVEDEVVHFCNRHVPVEMCFTDLIYKQFP